MPQKTTENHEPQVVMGEFTEPNYGSSEEEGQNSGRGKPENDVGELGEQRDVFGAEERHQIKYKTLSWPMVAALMIAEIVSNGVLSLPSGGGVVGLVPTVLLIAFLGMFGAYTGFLLVQFKLNHPQVHNMGDAGQVLFGRFGMELFTAGTVILSIFATGGQLLAGQIALKSLSNHKLCLVLYTAIFTVPTFMGSFPRTFGELTWLGWLSIGSILVAGIVGMIGAGIHPIADRTISAALSPGFNAAFISITNPVFSYAGHFIFFVLISEMTKPQDAFKAVYVLQAFATSFYLVFTIVTYYYLGNGVASPSFLSLPDNWQKAAWGIAIPSFLATGCLTSHTAAKLIFVRMFRNSKHLHSNTVKGWGVWTALIFFMNAAAFVLAVAVPIFNSLIGLAASMFASWFTYGIAPMFWLHDAYYLKGEKLAGWRKRPTQTVLCMLAILSCAFVCFAGMYVTLKGIIDAYNAGTVGRPFRC